MHLAPHILQPYHRVLNRNYGLDNLGIAWDDSNLSGPSLCRGGSTGRFRIYGCSEKMNKNQALSNVKRYGTAVAFILYPFLAGFAFAVHPGLLNPRLGPDIQAKIAGFHGNPLLHFGHVLMTLAVPLLIVIAVHFMNLLEQKAGWWGFIGGCLAVAGAVVLALDKAALCLAPSALDTLPAADFQAMLPGIRAIFQYQGWLWLLWLLPLLPLGFIVQTIGLVRSNLIPRWQSWLMLAGSILMANPDIDIVGLAATIILGLGFIPYGISLLREAAPADNLNMRVSGLGDGVLDLGQDAQLLATSISDCTVPRFRRPCRRRCAGC